MKKRNYPILVGLLIAAALFIHLFSRDEQRVEQFYSTGIYPKIAVSLRYLLYWVPVSLGDILYGVAACWIFGKIILAFRVLIRRQVTTRGIVIALKWWLVRLLVIYILFNLLWGINYNREGIAGQIGLTLKEYSIEDVKSLNTALVQKVNSSKSALLKRQPGSIKSGAVFDRATFAYQEANKRYPFLHYYPACVKVSLWGWLGNYLGFVGYYNPFTAEAQVNTTVPKFSQPFTTCHEIAHQLGYAKENEANFVGYLAASASTDTVFHYSVYLDLFLYAEKNLFKADTAAARLFVNQLMPEVKDDLKEWQEFHARHKNPAEPIMRWIYGKYLESNQQPSGVLSYDEVTGFMIAYYKKYGKL